MPDRTDDTEGTIYALDDGGRRRLGCRCHQTSNLYARENGWAISGYRPITTSRRCQGAGRLPKRAANGRLNNRALPNGGFRHGEKDRGGTVPRRHAGDGQAFLDLYAATGNRDWLTSAAKAGDFVATFKDEAGGFVTSKTSEGKPAYWPRPAKLIDDQVQVARFMNLLNRYYPAPRPTASRPRLPCAISPAPRPRLMRSLPGVLLADEELALEPIRLTCRRTLRSPPRSDSTSGVGQLAFAQVEPFSGACSGQAGRGRGHAGLARGFRPVSHDRHMDRLEREFFVGEQHAGRERIISAEALAR